MLADFSSGWKNLSAQFANHQAVVQGYFFILVGKKNGVPVIPVRSGLSVQIPVRLKFCFCGKTCKHLCKPVQTSVLLAAWLIQYPVRKFHLFFFFTVEGKLLPHVIMLRASFLIHQLVIVLLPSNNLNSGSQSNWFCLHFGHWGETDFCFQTFC